VKEVINVQTCPLCRGLHTYRIAVETQPDVRSVTQPLKARRRTFRGAFVCPTLGKEFKGSTTVLVDPGEGVKSAKVVGVEA
jgi:hypothetical protein